jgi:hypothetical protein
MPINMLCPNGHQLVTEDQYAGRKVRCPHCQAIVVVPGAAQTAVTAVPARAEPPRPERNEIDEGDVIADEDIISDEDIIEEEGDRPRRRRRREYEDDDYDDRPRKKKKKVGMTRKQMSLTNVGLGFHYARILTILIAMTVVMVCSIIGVVGGAGAAAGGDARGAAGALAFLGVVSLLSNAVGLFVAPALGITGSSLCCFVPGKTGAKPLIIVSLALDGAAFVLPILAIVLSGAAALRGAGAGAGLAALAFILLGFVCQLAGFVLFMLFLRQLARFMDDDGSADEAISIIIHWLILLIGVPVGFIVLLVIAVATASGRDSQSVGFIGCMLGIIMLIAAVAWIVFLVKLMFRILLLLGSLRQNLRTRYNV